MLAAVQLSCLATTHFEVLSLTAWRAGARYVLSAHHRDVLKAAATSNGSLVLFKDYSDALLSLLKYMFKHL